MKCMAAARGVGGGWLECNQRTHFVASKSVAEGRPYELRYCPKHYEAILGLPCPPAVPSGRATGFVATHGKGACGHYCGEWFPTLEAFLAHAPVCPRVLEYEQGGVVVPPWIKPESAPPLTCTFTSAESAQGHTEAV